MTPRTRRQAGRAAKAGGDAWERCLEGWHSLYLRQGRAHVVKRGPPLAFLSAPRARVASVRLEGDGPTDYGGVISPSGSAVDFEAKQTTAARWRLSELKLHQAEHLEHVHNLGGLAFVALQIGAVAWVLPWAALGPRWRAWRAASQAAVLLRAAGQRGSIPRGSGSLTPDDCDALGQRMARPGDWLPAVLELQGRS